MDESSVPAVVASLVSGAVRLVGPEAVMRGVAQGSEGGALSPPLVRILEVLKSSDTAPLIAEALEGLFRDPNDSYATEELQFAIRREMRKSAAFAEKLTRLVSEIRGMGAQPAGVASQSAARTISGDFNAFLGTINSGSTVSGVHFTEETSGGKKRDDTSG
jgi:hypothetical protein